MSRSEDVLEAAEVEHARWPLTMAKLAEGVPPNCRSGCPTQDHESYGQCLKAANIQVGPADRDGRKVWDNDLAEYRKVRKQGIQPKSVRRPAVEAAKIANDA